MAAKKIAESDPITHWLIMVILMIPVLLLPACNKETTNDDQDRDEPIPVQIINAQLIALPISAETVAQTEGAKEIEVRPRVGGILLKRLYEEGAPVEAGQPLFQIDPIPFENTLAETRAQLLEQRIRTARAEKDEKRMKVLVAKNFVSQRAYDLSMANYLADRAALESAKVRVQRAELNLSYTTVVAPEKGITGRSQFSVGALITANTSLLTTLVQLSPIWVRFSFSDNELVRFGGRLTKQNVQHVTVILANGSEYPYKGEINFAASEIDPLLGTQQLRATFENTEQQLLPGQFVRVRVAAVASSNGFVVPQVAVQTSDFGKYVYVVNEKNKAIQRPVVVGDWMGKDWIILEGLNSGDQIIVDNIIRLRQDSLVEIVASND